MATRLTLAPRTVVGYHGCTEEAAASILSHGSFRLSRKEYDWLGEGFYFFEYGPHRAWEWAQAVAKRESGTPAVIEATVRLGKCLNLRDTAHMIDLPDVYDEVTQRYRDGGANPPRNTERGAHFLDQEFVNVYCEIVKRKSILPFQIVRDCFPEAPPVYAGSKILRRTHVQIAVRDPDCIRQARRVPTAQYDEEPDVDGTNENKIAAPGPA